MVGLSREFGRFIKQYSIYENFDVVYIDNDSFVWDAGYSCQYRCYVTLISKQIIANVWKNILIVKDTL